MTFDGGSPTPVIVNDTVSQALVLVGQGTTPNRRVTVRDDLVVTSDLSVNGTTTISGATTLGGNTSVAGNLTVTGSLSGGNLSGTIAGGGTLVCQLGSGTNFIVNCVGLFGGASCGANGSSCSSGTRIICPSGATPRDVTRDCASGSIIYPCNTTSFCVRD